MIRHLFIYGFVLFASKIFAQESIKTISAEQVMLILKQYPPVDKQDSILIEKAKEESINTILDQVALKKKGKLDKVYVTGCLSHRYRDDLEKEIPEVDAWFGTMELPLILKQFEADYKSELLGERLLATPSHYA